MNWIEQVTILDLLVKGLIVGVVVSAPLGPVGVLCIQRTLNKGRWYGFVTGLGAPGKTVPDPYPGTRPWLANRKHCS